MTEFNYETYFKHASGVYLFLSWLQAEEELANKHEVNQNIIRLSPLSSNYFMFGKSKGGFYLAAQSTEAAWLDLIEWSEATIKDKELFLTSKMVKGDNENLVDLPPFAVGIFINHPDKIEMFKKQKKIIGREFLVEEDRSTRVNQVKILFSLKMGSGDKPLIPDEGTQKLLSYDDLIKKKIAKTNVYEEPAYEAGESDNSISENLANNQLIKDLFLKK